MQISETIQWILGETATWELFTNRSYEAKIQKSDPNQIYNVPGQPGIVYNILEDSYEKVSAGGYVVTGIVGEMWPIPSSVLRKYAIKPEQITSTPQPVWTVETDTVYAGIRIPLETAFTLETDYGEKALLKGNDPGQAHGQGDYVLVAAKWDGQRWVPDFNDSGRIVNGAVFDRLYQPFSRL